MERKPPAVGRDRDEHSAGRFRAEANRAGHLAGLPADLLRCCAQAVVDYCEDKPDTAAPDVLEEGEVGAETALPEAALGELVTAALAPGGEPRRVVWQQRNSEALVWLDRTRVRVLDGLVLVGVTLETRETGPQELTAVYAVGTEQTPAGMLAVAERRPRGHPGLAATFGEGVIALGWQTLLEVAGGLAGVFATDPEGHPARAGALVAEQGRLRVTPQAPHAFERADSREAWTPPDAWMPQPDRPPARPDRPPERAEPPPANPPPTPPLPAEEHPPAEPPPAKERPRQRPPARPPGGPARKRPGLSPEPGAPPGHQPGRGDPERDDRQGPGRGPRREG